MPTLTVEGGVLIRDGRPHQLISAAAHYFRILPELWEDRLERLAAMGVNAIETYVPGTSMPPTYRPSTSTAGATSRGSSVRPADSIST